MKQSTACVILVALVLIVVCVLLARMQITVNNTLVLNIQGNDLDASTNYSIGTISGDRCMIGDNNHLVNKLIDV